MKKPDFLAFLAMFVLLSVLLMGCARSNCYEAVSINPPRQFGIVFDACRGGFFYQPLPPMPGDGDAAARPAPDAKTGA